MSLELHRSTEQKSVQATILDFYGLREQPFGPSPNPRFYYPSATHREALATLISGIENELGFAALIAEPGMGKTMLLFDLILKYRDRAHTAFVFNTQCNSNELLRHIVSELQIPDAEGECDPVRLHQLFTLFVSKNAFARPVLIIIDEAQNLGDAALETVRLLSDFEAPDHKLLHVILAGQPGLGETLGKATLSQMLQRINTISRLNRYSGEETREYIGHRVKVAGGNGRALFTPEALARIEKKSEGVPRAVNRLCINALQLGFAQRESVVSADVIDEVIGDLDLRQEPQLDREELCKAGDVGTSAPASVQGVARSGRQIRTTTLASRVKPRGKVPTAPSAATRVGARREPLAFDESTRSSAQGQAELKARAGNVWQKRSKVPVYAAILVPVAVLIIVVTALNYRSNSNKVRAIAPAELTPQHIAPLPEPTSTNLPAESNAPAPSAGQEGTPASIDASSKATTIRVREVARHRSNVMPTPDEATPISISSAAPEGLKKRRAKDLGETTAPSVPATNDTGLVRDVIERSSVEPPKLAAMPRSRLVPGDPIDLVKPVYPPQAKTAHIQGDVILAVNVSREGTVEKVRVVRGPPILANAAVEAVRQWRYRPYFLNGDPIPVELNVTVSFRP